MACGSFFIPTLPDGNPFSQKKIRKNVLFKHLFTINQKETFNIVMLPFLCSHCIKGFSPIQSPICSKCGTMFISRQGDDHVCGNCLTIPQKFRTMRAVGIFDQTFMTLIHRFKYKGKIQLCEPLGILLFTTFIFNYAPNSIDIIIPVPLHKKKFQERGFNQAFLLVKDWGKWADQLNMGIDFPLVDKLALVRTRQTESQTGLGLKKRKINMKNAFTISRPSLIADKRILLIDDVFTTGATADECIKTLLKGGAKHIDVLSLARTM